MIRDKHVTDDFYEKRKHGTTDFPFYIYKNNFEIFKRLFDHRHQEAEIVYIAQGRAKITLDCEVYFANTHDFVFIGKNVLHQVSEIGDETLITYAIVFSLDPFVSQRDDYTTKKLIVPLLNNRFAIVNPITTQDPAHKKLYPLYRIVFDQFFQKPIHYQIKIKCAILGFLETLLEENHLKENDQPKDEPSEIAFLKAFMNIMNNDEFQDIKVEEIAKAMGYSKSYFMHTFKRITGKSTIQYINEIRLDNAKRLLLNTDTSIQEISYQTGFSNVSYFIKMFKKQNGCPPKQYRMKYKHFIDET